MEVAMVTVTTANPITGAATTTGTTNHTIGTAFIEAIAIID
jgi:hypothetical protein